MYEKVVDKYFPYDSFRVGQKEAIVQILDAMDEGYKHIILDAGTGFGKSSVARTICDYLSNENEENSFIMTSTKLLQEQYFNECISNQYHIKYRTCKGRSNFYCNYYGGHISCVNGGCKEKDNFKCPYKFKMDTGDFGIGCDYWNQKIDSNKSDVCIMNYDVLLSDYNIDFFKNRKLMICDEAHNINNKVLNRIGLTLNEKRLIKLVGLKFSYDDLNNNSIEYWCDRLYDYYDVLIEHIDNYDIYGHKPKTVDEIGRLAKRINSRLIDINYNPDFWFVYSDKFNRKITIKPLNVKSYVDDYLLSYSDAHIYMSGSIISPKNFSTYLGLNSDEVFYYKAQSSFNIKEQNPIIPMYCGKLNYKMKKRYLPKTIPVIEEILEKHTGEKGIIHCNSKEFTNYLMENVQSPRLITYNSSDEKESILEYFEESETDDVICSYSLEEGVDLPYDGVRFQILYKCPYPFLGDPQVKALMESDYTWYLVETIRKIVQAHGRGMRAEDDYCTNYLIDSLFKQVINNKLFPKEIKECVQ